MTFSVRSQIILIYWTLGFATVFGIALGFLLNMIPPPDANDSAAEVQQWYQDKDTEIKIGATIASYTSAFLLPFFVVIGLQISRHEKGGRPVWSVMAIAGGVMASIFLVLPPIFFGVAAFTPDRDPEITQLMHELGVLTLVTTTQYFIFAWVALIVMCLLPRAAKYSPFPRWYGYYCGWLVGMFELGALAFNWKTGPFSWNGLFVFWSPFTLFGIWILVTSYLLLKALRQQLADPDREDELVAA